MGGKKKTAIWIYASYTDKELDDVSLELLGKGQALAELSNVPLEAVLIGTGIKKLAEKLLDHGAHKVYYVDDKRLKTFNSSVYTHVVSELVKKHKPDVLLMSSDNQTASLAARIAVRFKTGLSAHCTDLKFDGQNLIQTVPGFGGNIMANIVCPKKRPQMATVTPGIFDAVKGRRKNAKVQIEKISIPKTIRAVKTIKHHTEKSTAKQSLGSAEIVITGGFGVGSKKNWKLVENLADALGATVGATRPPIDEGWADYDQMIGASGKVIKPKLYIGIGVSGMMHHTVGIQGANTIVAINNDPKAPIFSMADYGIVGDLKEVLPTLTKMLKTGEGLELKLKPVGHTRTPEEFKASLSKMRPNMYKFSKLIKDPVTDEMTSRTIEGHAQIYAAAHNPEYQDMVTTISPFTGKRISRYLSLIGSPEDMFANSRMKRLIYNLTGTCTGGRCAGWNAVNAMWSTTWDMDKDNGTDYHQRLRTWLISAQERDITLSGALTDPKGHRKKPPSRQADPDMYLHIVKKTDEGVVVRGAKVMICGVAAANEIFVMPGTNLKQSDAEYAVSFATPKDAKGITIVESRHASDDRDMEDGFDNPVTKGGITQAYIFFEDVFVPKDRIFMCGEYSYAGEAVGRFTLPYRSAIGACVAGQGDVMMGAAMLIARANGLPEKVFRDKLTRMMINNETTFAVGIAAAVMGTQHPSGTWLPDSVLANVNKVHVGTIPYETKRITQEIAGGIGETGCIPSYEDFTDSRYGHLLQKYLKAHSPAETRTRIARLIEWLTLGGGVPGCMHGGGSPDGARLAIWAGTDFDELMELAKRIGGISDISLT